MSVRALRLSRRSTRVAESQLCLFCRQPKSAGDCVQALGLPAVAPAPANDVTRGRSTAERPYFAFEGDLHAVPDKPTHCKRCGAELEPLRRYAGLCKPCIRGSASPQAPATEQLRCRFTVVRELYRTKPGHREKYVEVQCECGQKRTLKWSTWEHKRPLCCNQCRLKDINARGFEAEYAR